MVLPPISIVCFMVFIEKNRSGNDLLAVQFICIIRLRVFQSTVHFQLLTLPNSAIALSLLDPQHLHSMAVFSDTAKRLWGLCLFTRCSRPRVLTLRAGWNRLFLALPFTTAVLHSCLTSGFVAPIISLEF